VPCEGVRFVPSVPGTHDPLATYSRGRLSEEARRAYADSGAKERRSASRRAGWHSCLRPLRGRNRYPVAVVLFIIFTLPMVIVEGVPMKSQGSIDQNWKELSLLREAAANIHTGGKRCIGLEIPCIIPYRSLMRRRPR
jgi:hypothetical protein